MSSEVQTVTQDLNFAFTMYFVLEMAIKLMGLGPHRYVSDNFNIFDGVVSALCSAAPLIVRFRKRRSQPWSID